MIARRLGLLAAGTALILMIPLVLTIRDGGVEGQGWNWGPVDFVVMGALLFVAGAAMDFCWRRLGNPVFRLLAIAAIGAVAVVIWAELAVDAVSRLMVTLL